MLASHSSSDAQVQGLSVQFLLKGSLRRQGATLRIKAGLLEPGSGRVAGAGRFEEPLRDVLQVQDEISAQVVRPLQNRIDASLLSADERKGTRELQAYDNWLQGMDRLRRGCLGSRILTLGILTLVGNPGNPDPG